MPCTIKIRVAAARGLPIMDRSTELTDAYVELRLGTQTQRTEVCKRTLSPEWGADFRLEVADDATLQDHPLELKVWDADILTADDIIGVAYIDLQTLLMSPKARLGGWFPLHDTIRGLRGELQVSVRVEFFGDVKWHRESSASVAVHACTGIPQGLRVTRVLGLVEEVR
jgi:Ca2+-dependent lipid-binding protein